MQYFKINFLKFKKIKFIVIFSLLFITYNNDRLRIYDDRYVFQEIHPIVWKWIFVYKKDFYTAMQL